MASAAVEMLTLSHCRKMMVFNTDLGLDSDTDAELVNAVNGLEGKRMLSETEEDQDKGHVKKRRKQSKPVRIASSESLSDGENFTENGNPENKKTEVKIGYDVATFCQSSVNENANIMTPNSSDEEYKARVDNGIRKKFDRKEGCNDTSSLPINLSNSKCSSNDILPDYPATRTVDVDQNPNPEKTRQTNDVNGTLFQESNFEGTVFEREPLFAATSSSPLSFPSVKPVHGMHTSNNARHSGSPVRIFNPEAFCDLCNKEFCNKYFLKTHKANKHGIYSENIGPNFIDALPSLPFINYFSDVSEVLPSNGQILRTVSRKPQPPPSLPQQNSAYLQKPLVSNGNARAFCNVCQREFCNKYFVRRHKAKIHGIIDNSFPDTPPNETHEQKSQFATDAKSCSGNHEKSEDHEIYSSYAERQTSAIGVPIEDDKSYSPVERQNSIGRTKEPDSDGCASPRMPKTMSPVQTIAMAPILRPDDSSKETDQTDKIKRMCITNSEAFCEICCKEYCNKYFLRTHKMRSHGIAQPDWDKRDERPSPFENDLSLYDNQTVPLNLIVGDQSADKTENDGSEAIGAGIFCDTCGQKFRDVFLLKMHASYAHAQETYEGNPAEENCDSIIDEKPFKIKPVLKVETNAACDYTDRTVLSNSEENRYGVDFQTPLLSRCEICRKNVDALSLETHIETEHGNLPEEVLVSAEENSNSQTFRKEIKYDCVLCRRQFSSTTLLNQHIIECRGAVGEQMSNDNAVITKTSKETEELLKINRSHLNAAEVQTAPTSSFCEICKKELCNKYFMKTHMQRMHGISIDNGAHIGGVVCDICNKELCSKYFLRVHKQNSHGIVDEILGPDVSRNQSPGSDPSLRPSEQSDLNNRYFSHFTEVCTICSRRFRSMKWLKAHLLNDHGEEGKDKWKEFQAHYDLKPHERYVHEIQRKPDSSGVSITQGNVNGNITIKQYNDGYSQKIESTACQSNGDEGTIKNNVFTTIFNGKSTHIKQYRCSYCPFSTSILAFLFVHERSHINSSDSFLDRDKKPRCKICSLTFDTEEAYEKHCLSHSSDVSSSTSNGFGTDRNEKLYAPIIVEPTRYNEANGIMPESAAKDEGEKSIFHQFKTSIKCTKDKETGSDDIPVAKKYTGQPFSEPGLEFGRNELDFVESYDSNFSEDSRKEYIQEEKKRQNERVQTNEFQSNFSRTNLLDEEFDVTSIGVKESLELIANRTDVPVSFSLPQNQKNVIMQPFVLEDSGQIVSGDVKKLDCKKSFLSSIVFLPVTERVTNPVTVSFKLTPTL